MSFTSRTLSSSRALTGEVPPAVENTAHIAVGLVPGLGVVSNEGITVITRRWQQARLLWTHRRPPAPRAQSQPVPSTARGIHATHLCKKPSWAGKADRWPNWSRLRPPTPRRVAAPAIRLARRCDMSHYPIQQTERSLVSNPCDLESRSMKYRPQRASLRTPERPKVFGERGI
jgi:hypothetical protein